MPRGVATAKQLAMMAKVLEDHCAATGLSDPLEREALGATVLLLFDQGNRTEAELASALADALAGDRPQEARRG